MFPFRQVLCVNKSNNLDPHKRIINIGGADSGSRWKRSQRGAITDVELGVYDYFVIVAGKRIKLEVAISSSGNKYLKTMNDHEQPNSLLSLPECPSP